MIATSWAETEALAREFGVPHEDVTLIALNACGVRSELGHPRMRFRLRLAEGPEEELFFILPLGREDSPFELLADRILFEDRLFATVEALDNDDAVLSYFRKGYKVLTLNSNARSQCVGCAFCPNTLEAASDPRLAALDDMAGYLSLVETEMGWDSLASLDTVTVCTGCFRYEAKALDHLERLRTLLDQHHASANIHFLSSVIRTAAAFERIADEIQPFHLTLTIECLGNRDLVLKESKASLTYTDMVEVLRLSKSFGFKTDFTYIVGLDSLAEMAEKLPTLASEATTFPRFQVYQAHNGFMDLFTHRDARTGLRYFMEARRLIEQLFRGSHLRPQSWENYRPLWYFAYDGEPLRCQRI